MLLWRRQGVGGGEVDISQRMAGGKQERIRRVLRITAAPILSRRARIVAEMAFARSVCWSAISRKRCISV